MKTKLNKKYIQTSIAFILWFILIGTTIWANYYYWNIEKTEKTKYTKLFSELKEKKEEEVNSETKTIFKNIWKSSNLVYWLSLFHTTPTEIIEEVEKAIFIGRKQDWNYKIVTNENMSFSNYNNISIGLITEDLENFALLIKKMKKLYNWIFEFKWMKDFWIKREKNSNWEYTWKVFYTTSLNLKYLKDDYLTKIKDEDAEDENIYENNSLAFETLDKLLTWLKEKRLALKKDELYFNSNTKDNSIYLGTDIWYKDYDIFYINQNNNLIDIFSLNDIWEKDDYENLKLNNVNVILITKQNWSDYALCTKIEKENLTDLEKQEKDLNNWKIFTEIKTKWKLDKTLKTFCELL